MAEEQGQWAQAESYYQQALQIKIEYNDRYSQAHTYHQLGRVAEEQRQWTKARDYFLRDLEITAGYNDEYNLAITLHSLACLWRAGADTGLPATVAAVLGVAPEEAEQRLREAAGKGGTAEGAE